MNIQRLIDKKNLPKVACLVIAIFLYIYHQVSLVEKKSFVVPLQIIQEGNVMQLGNCPKNVTVTVRAEADDINSILNSDLHASINLNNVTETGFITVPVLIEVDEKLMAYDPLEVRVKPENITLSVDEKSATFLPISPTIAGSVANGYMITDIKSDPSVVGVIGPKSLLSNIHEIQTDAFIVSNADKNFSGEVKYFEITKLINVENKGPYKVTVSIEPQPMQKDYSGIHIVTRNLAENLEVTDEIPNIDFKLSGTVPILSKFSLGVNSVQLDCSNITEPGLYDVPVKITLPQDIKLESKSFESVSINVNEKVVIPEIVTEQVDNQ